ncbi:Transcriptional regulator, AbiEi antitoxin, Type IV TA system [Pseudomonas sp. NFACC08-1]|uniref:type IV toxin-antitoxin system AbiEi family antitoxin n=2 Tax=unclassified Pseudomonas TaxID=196821 RepID=UPI0008718BD8|nr:type IV toxin-antitoxin system AbiEi family antitoxin [Pseudomonas sp. NFACC05-1]SCW43540.1 Transcriptional regulator, AbiEi antitoxin, Type IV TA system [Pseudomonas sp. NFACC05-1]SDW12674.1 Transcriptional regulator, AbiEi antitoxin, Type IV TA system [Pseudomonas sp. NFACC08-1]
MKDFEKSSKEALCDLLRKVPIIEIKSLEAAPQTKYWAPDFIVEIATSGKSRSLVCEVKASGQPRFVNAAILQLRDYVTAWDIDVTAIVIAPYLSPAARQACREKGVGYLDLEGNAWISFDGVFIDRQVADKPPAEHRELKSLFKPKSAQILRAMLREPAHAWRVIELSEAASTSLGQVSNVRTALLDREWGQVTSNGFFLCDPQALLDAWVEAYEPPSGERKKFYTTLHGSALENAARSVIGEQSCGRTLFSSFSAAQWLAPYARVGTHYFYADSEGLDKLIEALQLVPAAKGENVVITVPRDEGLLLDTVEAAPGVLCTSPVQTYLDLTVAGERAKEAAEYLRQEKLTWPR